LEAAMSDSGFGSIGLANARDLAEAAGPSNVRQAIDR
jgi:hypothetical protein